MTPLQQETKRILMQRFAVRERDAHPLALGHRDNWTPAEMHRSADLATAQALQNIERRTTQKGEGR